MRLLLDEQISGKVAERLRKSGYDATAVVTDSGLRGLSDPDIFAAAQLQGRAVVTHNRQDFEAIVRDHAAAGRDHHGLVIVHPVRFPSRELGRLTKALARKMDEPLPENFVIWLQDR